jgi:NADPH:quinone reductase-like Zn-dependent oxidoreductase
MRAARLHEIGGTPRIDEIDAPDGGNILEVTMSSLNPLDIAIGTGRFYGGSPDPPYVIGSEAVGGGGDGRRFWVSSKGTMAERVVIGEAVHPVEVPAGVDDATAIACGVAGVSAWTAVAWRAQVTADDTVLVLGASGSLGSVAVQAAKLLGAKRVIGAGRRVEHIPDVADEAVELAGEYALPEASVVIDAIWGEPAERALAAAARGARFVQIGQSAGGTATLQSAWVRGKFTNILGHSLFALPADVVSDGYRELCEHVRDGRIRLDIEIYSLDDIAAAWERQASGSPGAKIAVAVR